MDIQLERAERFDTWHARYIINQVNNRAMSRSQHYRVVHKTWSKLADNRCVSLNSVARSALSGRDNPVLSDERWKIVRRKVIAQLNKLAQREEWQWDACDYRQCYQINKVAFEPEVEALNMAWRGKVRYQCSEMHARLKYDYQRNYKECKTWPATFERAFKRMKRLSISQHPYMSEVISEWEWCWRGCSA